MVKMLLRDVAMSDLAEIYERNAGRSPAPYLKDAAAIARARELAKKNGVWDDLNAHLDPSRDIPVLKRSAYRNYQRVGDRILPQTAAGNRRRELERATMALWLSHPNADVDYLQDLLWAYCDDHTWVMAAHEGRAIDLGSAALGAAFAEILHILGDQLEAEVVQRVSQKIEERIFEPFWNYKHLDFWKTARMNWNHVCNGEIIRTALYQIQDPTALAHMTHAAIINLTYALDGFTDDGGCEEGPGYWEYGFWAFFVRCPRALFEDRWRIEFDGGRDRQNSSDMPLSARRAYSSRVALDLCRFEPRLHRRAVGHDHQCVF